MEFEIQTDYTIDDCYAFWKAFIQKKPGRVPPKLMSRQEAQQGSIACMVVGLAALVGLMYLRRLFGPMSGLSVLMGMCVLLMLAGAWTAWRNRGSAGHPAYPYWVQGSYKKYQQASEQDIFVISESGFEAYGPGVDHHYDLSAVKNLWADETHFYVDLGKNTYYMLPHHNFTRGSPEDLPAFWIARTGRPVLPVSPEGRELEAFVQNQIQK